jgi:hypothetical protein
LSRKRDWVTSVVGLKLNFFGPHGLLGSLPGLITFAQRGELMAKLNKKPEKPYSKPTLTVYGAVQQLTAAVGPNHMQDGGTTFVMTHI